jgi:hypothetical protein
VSTLIVRFTRLDPTRHCFEAIRADGSRDRRELETRSLLLHDLVHFAVESEARLRGGFYGSVMDGASYDAPRPGAEAALIENVVAPLQAAIKAPIDAEMFTARLRANLADLGFSPPDWLSAETIRRALALLRQLQGQWRATPFGQCMELRFEI